MENGAWSMENVPEPVTFSFFIKVSPLPEIHHQTCHLFSTRQHTVFGEKTNSSLHAPCSTLHAPCAVP